MDGTAGEYVIQKYAKQIASGKLRVLQIRKRREYKMRLIKRVSSLVLALMLIVSGGVADMAVDKVSAASTVEIYSESDWNNFADAVNGGDFELSAVLMADFTATSDFIQIYGEFAGSFDGNGHSISGLTTSMFDYVTGGTVENLTVKDVAISEYVGYYSVGAIVDDLVGGQVSNCVVESGFINVEGSSVGGVVGYINGDAVVADCVNYANVSATGQIGGIVGVVNCGSVCDCVNNGTVAASDSMAGGIAGDVYPDEAGAAAIYNSYNNGSISAYEYAGGIAGQVVSWGTGITLQNVYNTGAISGSDVIGGIVGILSTMDSSDLVQINNVYNGGTVSTNGAIIGTVVGMVEPASSESFTVRNSAYVKDSSVNSGLYSVGAINGNSTVIQTADSYGSVAYSSADEASGKTAYELNNYSGFGSDWSYWAYDGSSIMLADAENLRTYKVTYMNGGSEYKTVYSLNTGLYEIMDSPAAINGSLFAGWFTEDLGTIVTVTPDTLSSAVNFANQVSGDLVLYPVYLSTGKVTADPADTSNSVRYDNSGLYLQGAQIREPNASQGVTAGLRFITRISTSFISNVEALNEANASLRPGSNADKGIGYGTVITAKSNITDGDMLIKDLSATSAMRGMYVSPAVINYREYNGYVLYTALVVGIPEAYYTTDIAARPYVTYCDANGVERTYYYVENSSSSVAGGGYYTSYQKVYNYIYGAS